MKWHVPFGSIMFLNMLNSVVWLPKWCFLDGVGRKTKITNQTYASIHQNSTKSWWIEFPSFTRGVKRLIDDNYLVNAGMYRKSSGKRKYRQITVFFFYLLDLQKLESTYISHEVVLTRNPAARNFSIWLGKNYILCPSPELFSLTLMDRLVQIAICFNDFYLFLYHLIRVNS